VTEVLNRRTLTDESDLKAAQSSIRADDQLAELRLGQTVSVYDFIQNGRNGQLTIWHDTGSAAIDLGDGSLWGFWDEENETIWVDDGVSKRQQFNASGECVAEFGR
jgi:hypothetical protein